MRPERKTLPPLPPPIDEPNESEARNVVRMPSAPRPAPKGATNAGRFEKINAFVDFSMCECTSCAALVWVALWRSERGGVATVAHDVLASRVGRNRRSVQRAVRELEGKGLLHVTKRGGLSAGPNSYELRGAQR